MMNEATPAATTQVENILGIRIIAGIIDIVAIIVIYALFAILFGDNSSEGGNVSTSLNGFPGLLFLVISFAYYLVPEALTGQTLGKKIMGIKVVALEGEMSWGKAAIRTILRIIDGLFLYLVGVLCIAISKKHQRIGDMAAGTIVVKA
jgi:uncharacterized RDD family membrane protein YckC